MKILPGINVAVIEGDLCHAKWIEELGTIHHDPWFRDQVLRHIKPGDVVVQGGANIGTLTRAMMDVGAKVIAFEANPAALECLRHNCPGIYAPVHAALSDHSAPMRINFDRANAGASYVSESVVQADSQLVVATRLDAWGLSPSLLLLDVEGHEVRALRGAAQTIARCQPIIICEVNRGALERAGTSDDELFALIESYGYRWEILQPECKRGDAQYDILATPK